MRVETWFDLITLLTNIRPALSSRDQTVAFDLTTWALYNRPAVTGVNQGEIDQIRQWFFSVLNQFTGNSKRDILRGIDFLGWLNTKPNAGLFLTQNGCGLWGHHWYDGSCHKDRKWTEPPPPPPPEPPPEPPPTPDPVPGDFDDPQSCTLGGF